MWTIPVEKIKDSANIAPRGSVFKPVTKKRWRSEESSLTLSIHPEHSVTQFLCLRKSLLQRDTVNKPAHSSFARPPICKSVGWLLAFLQDFRRNCHYSIIRESL